MATKAQWQPSADVKPKVKISEMDHIVLRVKDIDSSLHFYCDLLGLKVERLQEFREGKCGFPSARLNADTIIDLFPFPDMEAIGDGPRNQDHFCMVVEKTDLAQVKAELEALGIRMRSDSPGPVTRWGAHGSGISLYFHDPDDNVVELRYYE